MTVREDFFQAIYAQDERKARDILATNNFNPNIRDRTSVLGGTPAISLAVRLGLHELATDLVARGADVKLYDDGLAPIHMAIDPRGVDILAARGADVSAPWRKDGVDLPKGTTALHTAARANRPAMIEALLKAGANPNAKDKDGFTPLHYAASRSEIVARQLLEAGARPHMRTNTGLTAREVLERHQPGLAEELGRGNAVLAKTLLDKGAEPNVVGTGPVAKPSPSTTPLHFAAMHDNAEMAQILLAHGANVNAVDGQGLAPLHYAATQSQGVVDVLLKNGADVSLKTPTGASAKDLLDLFSAERTKSAGLAPQSPTSGPSTVPEVLEPSLAVKPAAKLADQQTTVQASASPSTANAVAVSDGDLPLDASPEVVAAAAVAVAAASEAASVEGVIRQGKPRSKTADVVDAGGGVIRQASPQERKAVDADKPKSLLGGQFVGNEKGEYTRVGEKRVALLDDGSQIQLKDREMDTFAAGVELAKAKGWSAIEVEGSEKFKREAWLTASEAGLEVQGYEPTQKDKQELEKRLSKRAGQSATTSSASPASGSAVARDANVAGLDSSLSEAQDQVLGASKSYVAPNLQSGLYAGKVLAETPHHIVVTVDGRANTATALEKSKLGGVPFKLNETLKVRFRDGKAVAPSIKNQKSKSISR